MGPAVGKPWSALATWLGGAFGGERARNPVGRVNEGEARSIAGEGSVTSGNRSSGWGGEGLKQRFEHTSGFDGEHSQSLGKNLGRS
jgi:hypothetical protein